jgi:hypothetical protein
LISTAKEVHELQLAATRPFDDGLWRARMSVVEELQRNTLSDDGLGAVKGFEAESPIMVTFL